jgi:hypothetical protein
VPQPIDLQTELGRLMAVERVQQVADRVSLVAQQRVAADEQQQRVGLETQVQQTHAKSEEIEPEMRRKNPYMGRRKHRAPVEPESEEKPRPPVSDEPHQLDITV